MSLTSLADKSVTIERLALTADAWGADKRAWSSAGTGSCRIQPVSGLDAIVHSKPDLRITHRLYFPGAPDIQAGDRLDYGGTKLYVQVIRDIDQQGRLLTVDCEERDG